MGKGYNKHIKDAEDAANEIHFLGIQLLSTELTPEQKKLVKTIDRKAFDMSLALAIEYRRACNENER